MELGGVGVKKKKYMPPPRPAATPPGEENQVRNLSAGTSLFSGVTRLWNFKHPILIVH